MPWHGIHVRGKTSTLLGRAALTAVTLASCYVAITFSLAQMLVDSQPVQAHRLAPFNGLVTARLALSLVGSDAELAQRRRADAYAREAIKREPLAVPALSTLAVDASLRGDNTTARALFGFTEKISRRDLPTQLWAIEDAVQQGNVARALHHYDIVFRVWPTMWEMLFPVLASASAEAQIREQLARKLLQRPAWADGFVEYVASYGNPDSSARLLILLRHYGGKISQRSEAAMVASLLKRPDGGDAAWTYYASLHPQVDRHRSRDPAFRAALDAPSQFDWIANAENGIVATLDNGSFNFIVPPSVGGPMLRQVQMLPPGRYVLTGRSAEVTPSAAAPYWSLACQDGRELGRVPLTSSQVTGKFTGQLSVPAGCPLQTLTLVAQPSDALGGLAGQINYVQLVPALIGASQ